MSHHWNNTRSHAYAIFIWASTTYAVYNSMENYTNLEVLYLSNNKIGREGCRSISKLLQKEGTRLNHLDLDSTNVGNEEAEILANSLRNNASLKTLELRENNITEKGYRAFSKLLYDVSSIDNTYLQLQPHSEEYLLA